VSGEDAGGMAARFEMRSFRLRGWEISRPDGTWSVCMSGLDTVWLVVERW